MTDHPFGSLSVHRDTDKGREIFVTFDSTGVLTAFNGHVDLGTGIQTALAQIVAEEAELPLSRVQVILGDTACTPDQGPTIASETIQVAAVPLRLAAAQLRGELAARGARRLNAPEDGVTLRDGMVHWKDTSVAFEALLEGREEMLRLDPATPLKSPADYTIVGHKTPRQDLPAKVIGQHTFIHDVDVAGMVHGHVLRPPYAGRDSGPFIGTSLLGWNEDAVRDMPGFIAVVRKGDFLGVVADRADQAQAIAEALPVRWRTPPSAPDLRDLRHAIRNQPATPRALDRSGDFEKEMAEADTTLSRSYVWPYHLHGSIGPSCAVADWNNGRPVVWSGSQNPHMLRGDLATLTGLPSEAIEIRRYQAAGCYGRNCADDVCGDALLLAQAVGRPVRVQLTRAQEHLWEPKGAAQLMDIAGGLKDGALHAYSLDTWYPSNRAPNLALLLTGAVSPEPRPSDMGDRTTVPPYRIPHKRITVHDMAPIVRAAWMRGVSALPNTFAHESFIDEMAHEAGTDPIEFRLAHIDDPRATDLIRRTAEAAGWDTRTRPRMRREGRMAYGSGFAYATYVHGTFPGTAAAAAAWVCDVAVDMESGEVTLTRVFVGQDQGLVINPDGVRQQIHGNVHQTASRVLKEEVSFDEITVTPQSWANYPILTFPETPQIETLLIARPEEPALGVGESAAVPAAAAIAGAIFDATGVRMREAPFTPEKMRAALGIAPQEVTPPALPGLTPVKKRRKPRVLAMAAALGGALTAGAVAMPMARAIPASPAPGAGSFSEALLQRGSEVFALGNCATCHTAEGGSPNAGGRAVETPFGTIYTTNITPDPETGLGDWSFTAFDRAMRQGISRDGHNLYPAFPYTSFAKMSGEDMYALYGYLQTLPPVRAEAPQAQMVFPTNLRPTNAVWNMLYHRPGELTADPAQSEAWNRGRYLVEGAGHCSACHSPRSALGAEQGGTDALSGAMVKNWFAPALAGRPAGERGWDEESLFSYLRSGVAPGLAAASGPMADVVDSLAPLPDADIRAMATYLASLTEGEPVETPAPRLPAQPDATHRLFESACATCHEPAIAGTVTAAHVPLGQSMAIRAPGPEALATVIRDGLVAPLSIDLRDMPAFGGELSETQIESLSGYLRARYAPDLPPWP
ncbi:aldehyde dehydrogenase (plasmid) [Sagittula sp. P11]|uniref:molybdopterin cofactor-binding domain-containing protein n=1 Tax=Sagittula sp. P11 TaxID=2009329 RepID=UPI000C2D4113|nr:molybdopterin cofactor-binding domain-containing protein [Sagittula sp. P11]AUC56055.1 aldehyde dehydrogenase [Sagittula sp. P11]